MNRTEFAKILGGEPHLDHQPQVVAGSSSDDWSRSFVRAAAGQGPVFLANPDWGSLEKEQFAVLCQERPENWDTEVGWLMVPTGGSSGEMKLARHDQMTLMAAIRGAAQHFGISCFHSVGALPRYHVGGLMAWLRCKFTGGTYLEASWRRIAEGGFPSVPDQSTTVSLVPTQLSRLRQIEGGTEWLKRFELVMVGGAALDRSTRSWARQEGIRLSPCYGATETAAMAAALRPDEFLKGARGVGCVLPHMAAEVGPSGKLLWRGTSLFRGYWPKVREPGAAWSSGDLGEISETGEVSVRCRADGLINTGGEKVNPVEVESVLAELLADRRIKVVGIPHEKWGESVIVAHAPDLEVVLPELWTKAADRLAKYKWPKQAVAVSPWPVNAMGKLNTRRVAESVRETLGGDRA